MKSVIAALALFATISHAGAAGIWDSAQEGFHQGITERLAEDGTIDWVDPEAGVFTRCRLAKTVQTPVISETGRPIGVALMNCRDGIDRKWVQVNPELARFNGVWFRKCLKDCGGVGLEP